MTPPPENTLAAFPPSRTAGNVVLRPLTLAGAILLGRDGVDCRRAVPHDKLFRAAYILAQCGDDAFAANDERGYRRFLRKAKCGLKELCSAVEAVLNDAFETWVKPPAPTGKTVEHLTPHGLGWPLEWAEFLCGEYGWTWREALAMPVATVFALGAACRQRHGGRHAGFDYIERQYRKEIKTGRAKPFDPFDKRKEKAV